MVRSRKGKGKASETADEVGPNNKGSDDTHETPKTSRRRSQKVLKSENTNCDSPVSQSETDASKRENTSLMTPRSQDEKKPQLATPKNRKGTCRKSTAGNSKKKTEAVDTSDNDSLAEEKDSTCLVDDATLDTQAITAIKKPRGSSKKRTDETETSAEHDASQVEENSSQRSKATPRGKRQGALNKSAVTSEKSLEPDQAQSLKTLKGTPKNKRQCKSKKGNEDNISGDENPSTPLYASTPQTGKNATKRSGHASKRKAGKLVEADDSFNLSASSVKQAKKNSAKKKVAKDDQIMMDEGDEDAEDEDANTAEESTAVQDNSTLFEDVTPSTGRQRRSAAIKARGSMKNIAKILGIKSEKNDTASDEGDDSDCDPDVKFDEEETAEDEDEYDESGEDEEEDEKESSYGDEEFDEECGNNKRTSRKRPPRHRPSNAERQKDLPPSIIIPPDGGVKLLAQFLEDCCRGGLFWTWRPRLASWRLLSASESEKYLPKLKQSVSFSTKVGFGKRFQLQATDVKLGLFQTLNCKSKYCFVGGPIRAMDWCPVPAEQMDHYLALYAVPDPDFRHTALDIHSNPGLIQFWNCGNLSKTTDPVMCLAIAVDYGPIHDLKWCRFGVFEKPTEVKGQWYKRLGLLAVAGCDGAIHIYSIPHPQQLKQEKNQYPIYMVKPEAKLVPSLHSPPGAYGPCLCIDWQWKDGAQCIFAGFGKGQVAIWQLDIESLLLHKEADDGVELFAPVMSFAAHLDAITGLSICQDVPQYFTTVSQDRCMKIWDRRRQDVMVNSLTRTMFTAVYWSVQRGSIFICQDSTNVHENFGMVEIGYFGMRYRPLANHEDVVWGIDCNMWLSALLGVDGAGNVAVTKIPITTAHGKSSRYAYYASTAKVTNAKKPTDEAGENDKDMTSDDTKHLQAQKARSSYQELNDRCQLTYYEEIFPGSLVPLLQPHKRNPHGGQTARCHDGIQLPLQAVYKAKWNPNLAQRTWFAAGGQAGILMLMNCQSIDNPAAAKLQKTSK